MIKPIESAEASLSRADALENALAHRRTRTMDAVIAYLGAAVASEQAGMLDCSREELPFRQERARCLLEIHDELSAQAQEPEDIN